MTQTDTGTQAGLLSLLRSALIVIGGLLAGHGVIGPHDTITPDNWQFIVGAIMTLAPIAWGYWDKIQAAKTTKEKEQIAVQAGINLVHEGASILIEDASGKQVPKPVTQDTAQAIIQNFGPTPEEAKTAELNKASLEAAKGITP